MVKQATVTSRTGEAGSVKPGPVKSRTKSPAKQNGTRRSTTASTAKRGIFITLEGGEGSGKSTQMRRLAKFFKESGRPVVTTREPGGSPGAEAVRHVLLSGAAEPYGADMEAILFAAARGDHVDTVIAPALNSGKVVITDRFFDSTRVYQGVSGKVEDEFVRRLEKIACRDIWPDITIIIDLDPKEGMERAGKRRKTGEVPDRFEKESLKLQDLRRKAYLKIAREEPERCVVVDGSGTEDEVFNRIVEAVSEKLDALNGTASPKAASMRKTGKTKPKLMSHKALTAKRKPASARKKASPSKEAVK